MLRLVFLTRLDLVLLWIIVYAMTVKPDFGDTSSNFWGIVGAAVAAGLVYWRHRAATNGTPATSAADA